MSFLRAGAAALAVMLFGVAVMLVAAPDAGAQAPSGNTYHLPPRFVANPGPEAAECSAGTSVVYQANDDGLDEAPITIRYCTFPVGEGRVPVTTEVECLEARANGFPGAGWVPEAGLCFGGGNIGAGLTAELCQGAVFVDNVDHPNPAVGTTNMCIIPVYKTADVDIVVPADVVTAWGLQGLLANVELSPSFLARLDAAGLIQVTVNPTVYNGPVPADGILRFTIPAGFEDAQYTVRATGTDGSQVTFDFSFNDVLPTAEAPAPAPTPPPELEMKLTDPYTCGGGFSGEVENGQAPYTISYRIDGQNYSADLGSFVSPTGVFETPEGYLNYSQIPDGIYSVSIRISDSSQWTRSIAFDGFATEHITDDCGDSVPSVAAVPAAQPADHEQPVGLAVTGATTDAALLVSQLLLGLGLSTLALLRLSHIRRRND